MSNKEITKAQQGTKLKDYVGAYNQTKQLQSNPLALKVSKADMLSEEEKQLKADNLLRLGHADKIKNRETERVRQLALIKKGQTDIGNNINDVATGVSTLMTQFRSPTNDELEKGRSGIKGKAEIVSNMVTHGLANELAGGAMNWVGGKLASGEARQLLNKGVSRIKSFNTSKAPVRNPENTYYSLEDLPMEGPRKINVLDRLENKIKKATEAKVLPLGKQLKRPGKLSIESRYDDEKGLHVINMLDEKKKSWGYLSLTDEYGDIRPGMIRVDPLMRRLKMQDPLYQEGINYAKSMGSEGLRSGDHLLSPDATYKAWSRFNTRNAGQADYMQKDAVIMLDHKSPTIVKDWINNYEQNVKKNLGRERLSLKDVYNQIIPSKKLQQGLPSRISNSQREASASLNQFMNFGNELANKRAYKQEMEKFETQMFNEMQRKAEKQADSYLDKLIAQHALDYKNKMNYQDFIKTKKRQLLIRVVFFYLLIFFTYNMNKLLIICFNQRVTIYNFLNDYSLFFPLLKPTFNEKIISVRNKSFN